MTTGRAEKPTREKEGGRIVLLMLVGLAVLAGGAYAAAYLAAGDRVPRGTTVAGVAIGGLTPDDAVTELEIGLVNRENAALRVSVGEESRRLRPAQTGLAVDYAESVAAAGGGRSWDPTRLWDYYTGGDELAAAVVVDEDAMEAALSDLADEVGTPPRDGSVAFRDGKVVVVDARQGQALDTETAREALESAYLDEGDAEVALSLTVAEPDIDTGDVSEALDSFANPAVSAPVTLLFDDSQIQLAPRDYAGVLQLRPRDGELVPGLDRQALTALVDSRISTDEPVDATVSIVDGEPRVIPARPGVTYRPADVEKTFLSLVAKPSGKREQQIKAVSAAADFTTADARALEITERVSTFTTYFPYAEYRNVNLGRAAEIIDGTLLEPDEVFSLNGIVGERTVANGFTEGYIISDGILITDLGGGVSQMATTTFNAAFFAGMKDVEHKAHSFYIDRYPVGREATVAWGSVDLQFQNDTPYGALVTANVTPSTPSSSGVVTVSIWSTKYWDITTSASDRYNFTEAETRRINTLQCHPNEGYGGFDVDVWRYFRKPGSSELVREEKFHTTYTPSDNVICTNPNAEDG
ncbi:MAG: VanW family protein [Nocardioides sp.]